MKHLSEGESIFVQGSGKNPYTVKNSGGVISCSCPAWRNQSLAIDMRTCKHIKANVSNGAAPSVQSGSVVNGTAKAPNPTKKVAVVAPPCLLAHTWDGEQDMDGWHCSFKLDGVRAWWDGKDFWSRLGNKYNAPQWFKDAMPDDVLDGELFAGNGKFQETVSTVRKLNGVDAEWKNIKFMVFDMPTSDTVNTMSIDSDPAWTFEERIDSLQDSVPAIEDNNPCIALVEQIRIDNSNPEETVLARLKQAEALGYEGLMLRQPGSLYVDGRSHTLLKVKTFVDCEATVIDYEKGKGKHKGRMGALVVRLPSGVEFSVGSGFTDKERENPPKLGSKVTVKYQELTKDGVPRFPTYISERDYE